MITIDLVCEACGESNPPGTEFCRNCNAFLAWDRSVLVKPPGGRGPSRPPGPDGPPATPAGPPEAAPHAWTAQPAGPAPAAEWAETPTADYGAGYVDPTYAQAGYPDQGYADAGYPPQGGYGYDQAAYDQAAYDQGGYDQAGYDQGYGGPYAELTCPTCGRVNEGARRYCAKCGYSFVTDVAPDPYATNPWGSAASQAAADRAARREYRRSLPPLYRWRRVMIGVLVVALLVVAGVVLHRDPVGVVKDAWYGLNKRYVTVTGVVATVLPAGMTAAKSDPKALVDGSVNEWTMNWAPSGTSACGPAPGTGVVVLTFPATRIRQIQIVPGLDQSNPQRALQYLPKDIGLSFGNGPCHPVTLKNTATQAAIPLDSGTPVTEVRLAIGSAYPAPADVQPLISITEVILQAYPS